MIFFNRWLPFLTALSLAIIFLIVSLNSSFLFYLAAVMVLINFMTIWSLADFNLLNRTFWNFFPVTFIFLASSFAFFIMIDVSAVRIIFCILISFIYLLFLRNIFTYLHQTKDYQPYAIENIFSYVGLTTLFLLMADFYGFILILGWPTWLFVIASFLFSGILFIQTLWSLMINWLQNKLYVFLVSLLMMESFYVISLLPTSYLFNALISMVIYYLSVNLLKDFLRQKLELKIIGKYLIYSAVVIIFSLLTARWY